MADRILTWHIPNLPAVLPAYYLEQDFEALAVRIHSEIVPHGGDLELDIFDDGVSIFNNHASSYAKPTETFSEIHYGVHSAHFTAGEVINGGSSSASARVEKDTGSRLDVTLLLTTAFTKGETISGVSSGSTATVDSFVRGGLSVIESSDVIDTTISLPADESTSEDDADFNSNPLEEGSWLTCKVTDAHGAKNITVHLELRRMAEDG